MTKHVAAALLTLGIATAAAPAGLAQTTSLSTAGPAGPAWQTQQAGRELVERALAAHDGALRATPTARLKIDFTGNQAQLSQSPRWDRPAEFLPSRRTYWLDLGSDRVAEDRELHGPGGFRLTTLQATDRSGGWKVDPQRRGTGDFAEALGPEAWAASRSAAVRLVPQLILARALERASTIRGLGRIDFRGRPADAVAFTDADGVTLNLYFEPANGRLVGYDLLRDDSIAGDQVVAFEFADYAQVDGRWLPSRRREWRNGALVMDGALTTAINPLADERPFLQPEGYRPAAENAPEESNLKLGDGVWLLQNLTGQERVLAVEFADHVAIVEAPGPAAHARSVLERLAKLLPGKPLRYVSFSHHHSDHGAGLRPYIARDIAIVATEKEAGFVRYVAEAPHRLVPDDLTRAPRPLKLTTFRRRHVLEDKANRLELIDVGPNSHSDAMVVAWLPRQRVLFQADLLNLPDAGTPAPAIQLTVEGLQAIEKLGIRPLKVAGVHGEVGTMDDWRAEVNARRTR